jgi:hypothetical protein
MAAASAASSAVPLVNLAQTIHLLHTYLTVALCNTVFQRVRNRDVSAVGRWRPWPSSGSPCSSRAALADPGAAGSGHDVPRPGAGPPHLPRGFLPARGAAAAQFLPGLVRGSTQANDTQKAPPRTENDRGGDRLAAPDREIPALCKSSASGDLPGQWDPARPE